MDGYLLLVHAKTDKRIIMKPGTQIVYKKLTHNILYILLSQVKLCGHIILIPFNLNCAICIALLPTELQIPNTIPNKQKLFSQQYQQKNKR